VSMHEVETKLEQILGFAGFSFNKDRYKYLQEDLQEIVDMLYPHIIRAKVLYEVRRVNMVLSLVCGHNFGLVVIVPGQPMDGKCLVCRRVMELNELITDLWHALISRSQVELRRLRDKLRELGYG